MSTFGQGSTTTMLKHLFLGLWLIVSATATSHATTIRYIAPVEGDDEAKDYYSNVLSLVCDKIREQYGSCSLMPERLPMGQQRQLMSLNKGVLDIMWTVTTAQREEDFRAIRVPLTMGLIGYRVAVLNRYSVKSVKPTSTTADLKKLLHVQGYGWPDATILQSNGFNVRTTDWYNSLYSALSDGQYDALLRGVLEVVAEVETYNENVEVDQHHLIHYPSAMYFFVAKNNVELATKIENALYGLIRERGMESILMEFAPHSHAIAALHLSGRKVHRLDNPLFPSNTDTKDAKLWLQAEDFSGVELRIGNPQAQASVQP